MNSPFRGSDAVAAGLVTEDALRTPAWQRVFRDVYVSSAIELTHLVRCRAAALVLPAAAAVSHGSAAYLHGCDVIAAQAPVDVSVVRQIRPRLGCGCGGRRWRHRTSSASPVSR